MYNDIRKVKYIISTQYKSLYTCMLGSVPKPIEIIPLRAYNQHIVFLMIKSMKKYYNLWNSLWGVDGCGSAFKVYFCTILYVLIYL